MTQAQTQPADAGEPAPAPPPPGADRVKPGRNMGGRDMGPDAAATDDPLLAAVLASLDDDQAQDIVSIALEGKSSIADYMVIASGRSTRQVAAIAQHLAETLKKNGFGPVRLEGLPAADWVLIDAGDVVVHLFRPEVRSFYNLERMWAVGDAPTPAAGTA